MTEPAVPNDFALVGRLGAHFAELGQLLSAGQGGSFGPTRLVAFAARVLEHGDDCGLTVVPENRPPSTAAAAGDLAPRVDTVQFIAGEGPCLEAAEARDYVRVDDLATDDRWPAFGPRCVAETGVRSVLSIRVPLAEGEQAALNFYATAPAAFDEQDVGVGAILAPFAALAVRARQQEEQAASLEAALRSSRQIGAAVGILMARDLITADEAFARLAAVSQHLNRKVRDIAEELTQTGALLELPATRRGRATSHGGTRPSAAGDAGARPASG